MKPIVDAFAQDRLIPMTAKYKEYLQELRDFFEKSATREDGTIASKMVPGPDGNLQEQFEVNLNDPQIIAGKSAIDNRFKDAIIEYRKDVEDYNLFMNKECEEEIRLFYIPLAMAPEDKDKFDIVAPLIKEMTPDQQARWEELFSEIASE